MLRSSEIPCAFIEIDESDRETLTEEELNEVMNEMLKNFNLLWKKELKHWFSQSHIHL